MHKKNKILHKLTNTLATFTSFSVFARIWATSLSVFTLNQKNEKDLDFCDIRPGHTHIGRKFGMHTRSVSWYIYFLISFFSGQSRAIAKASKRVSCFQTHRSTLLCKSTTWVKCRARTCRFFFVRFYLLFLDSILLSANAKSISISVKQRDPLFILTTVRF